MRRRKVKGVNPRVFDSMHKWPLLGIDEVGTGCIAGPIAVGAVVLPKSLEVLDTLEALGCQDSKMMTPYSRERVAAYVREHASFHKVVYAYPRTIESMSHQGALDNLYNQVMVEFHLFFKSPGAIILDGNYNTRLDYFHIGTPKGDQKSLTVAAASVLAKDSRDTLMIKLSDDYPGYGFENHKGYLTRTHRKALEKLGAADIHRRNTKTIRNMT